MNINPHRMFVKVGDVTTELGTFPAKPAWATFRTIDAAVFDSVPKMTLNPETEHLEVWQNGVCREYWSEPVIASVPVPPPPGDPEYWEYVARMEYENSAPLHFNEWQTLIDERERLWKECDELPITEERDNILARMRNRQALMNLNILLDGGE